MSTRERGRHPADHRFAGFPLPLVVHIVGAATFALVGILPLLPRFRRRHLVWHRRAGRALAVAGLPALPTGPQQA